ncbi:hypothetical protein Aoki45_39440 [Algoriphagus sp. oki45]|nr:hypothetical protein Aoki45_39440 [Algoriphagus sp. oki45]
MVSDSIFFQFSAVLLFRMQQRKASKGSKPLEGKYQNSEVK